MGTLKEYLNDEQYDDTRGPGPMTSPSPAAPETPAPSLEEAARTALERLRVSARIFDSMATFAGRRTGESHTKAAEELERALSAESSREKLRREAAEEIRQHLRAYAPHASDYGPAVRAWVDAELPGTSR